MIYIVLFLLSFILTWLIKNYAIKKSLFAHVNERSSHEVPTPHGGGIAIAITWFMGLVYLFLQDKIDANLFYALFVGIIISAVSLIDDIYDLSPKIRLFVQFFVAILGLYFLGGLDTLTFGLFDISNFLILNIFALLMIVWFVNLTNFIDGINGYVGSEFIFLGLSGFIVFNDLVFMVLVVCVLGFLFWNWNKAKIFMGDVGSTLLGYNIAILTIYYADKNPLNLWILITLFGLFWFDATVTLIRRKFNGEVLSKPHKKHAYQRLTQANWSHFKVTNYSIGLNVIIFLLVYFVSNVFVSFILSIILLQIVMKFIDSKKSFV